MKKIVVWVVSLFYILNAQTTIVENSSLEKTLKNIDRLDRVPNVLDLKSEETFFYFDRKEAFGTAKEFIDTDFNLNKNSPKYKIYLFYKEFLSKHIQDSNRTLFNSINLKRLNFVYRYFVGEERDRYYIASLNSIAKETKKAYLYLAEVYYKQRDYNRALEYAKMLKESREAQNIIENIESKYLSLTMERINLKDENILARVDFRNLDKIYIKIVKLDLNSSVEFLKLSEEKRIKYLKSVDPVDSFNIKLPDDGEHKNLSTEISLGKYALGSYAILLSSDKNFDMRKSTSAKFEVSNIALLKRGKKLLVVDRKEGTPLFGAKVIFYEDIDRESKITSIFTDKRGLVEVPKSLKRYFVDIIYRDDKLSVADSISQIEIKRDNKSKIALYLFKDKDIYRPNDKINFKGLILKSFPNRAPKILPNTKVKLELISIDKKFDSKIFKSDEFGAFSGSLRVPEDVGEDLILKSTFNTQKLNVVKDTKDSRFKIELKREIVGANSVDIRGEVVGDNGSLVDVKSIRFYLLKNGNLIKISKRDIKGSRFSFKFRVSDGNIYQLFVVATDIKGEKGLVSFDYNLKERLRVKLLIDKILDKNSPKVLRVRALDFRGRDVNISGRILVEKITPIKLFRYRYWQRVKKPIYNEIEFGKKFVSYLKKEDIETVEKLKFDTKKSDKLNLKILESGLYKITLFTTDKFGKDIEVSKRVVVYDKESPKPPYKTYLWHMLDKKSYSVGSTAIVSIKSSKPHLFAIFELEKSGEIIREEFLELNPDARVSIPIKKEYRGGLNYSITTVADNRVYIKRGTIDVPWDNRLGVEYISFNKLLKPDVDESWKFKVYSKERDSIESQMLALISSSNISFNIDSIYSKNRQNFTNLWRAFEFDATKLRVREHIDSIGFKPLSNIVFKLKYKEPKKSLSKTLLFEPRVNSNKKGELSLNFKTPQDIGKYRFLALIHSKDLKFALINKEIEIRKDLILNSNLPSFFRMGDSVSITNSIINRSGRDLNLTLSLELVDLKSDRDILKKELKKSIYLKNGETKKFEFQLDIPNVNIDEVEYRLIAKSKDLKEELKRVLPLIKDSTLETKSMLFRLEPKESKSIVFKPLEDINLTNSSYKRFIIEFTSNLSWEAIMVTKPLIEKRAYSNIEIFDKYFVSAIVSNLIKAYKSIDRINIFDIDRVLKAKSESLNRLLKENIGKNGGWGWFKDRDSNFFVTLYILDGFRKLREIGIKPKVDRKIIENALRYIDSVVLTEFNSIKNYKRDNLSADIIYYLYVRSFYNNPLLSREAYKYYIDSIKKYWRDKILYEKALIALTLNKKLGKSISLDILEDIERYAFANSDNNLVLYFKGADIITHTTIMELFSKLADNQKRLELMKIWLIEQKGISGWGSSILTANSVYAILSDSKWILDNIKPIDISFDSKLNYRDELKRVSSLIKEGVGYYRLKFNEFDRGFSKITLKNSNDKPIWGHIYLEYLDDTLDLKNLPIVLSKSFSSKLKLGAIVDVTLKVKLYKNLSFLVLRDELPLAFDIVENSGCFVDNGLRYYRLVTKGNVNFYFPYLPKGEYRFKYRVKVTHKGLFRGGITTIKTIFSDKTLGYFKMDSIKIRK